jgi:hypothetical protein
MGIPRLIERLDLLMEPEKNFTRRVAGLELSGEWMCKKILLCVPFICVQGIAHYQLEAGRRGGRGVNAGHKSAGE